MTGEELRREEERIFAQWRAKSSAPERVVVDGVLDAERWCAGGARRVLFVLRDKNGNVGERYRAAGRNDFRGELAACGSGARTWNNAARWGHALLAEDARYEDVRTFAGEARGRALRPFAVMNLIKEYGCARTDRARLDAAAQDAETARLLRAQADAYAPDLIVACGMRSGGHKSNMELLAAVYGVPETAFEAARVGKRAYRYFLLKGEGRTVPVLEFYHPQATAAAAFPGLRGHALWKEMFGDVRELGAFFRKMCNHSAGECV